MLESGSWGHSVLQTPALVLKYFSDKTGFDISCKLSPMDVSNGGKLHEVSFLGKIKKNIINLSAELAQRVVKVKKNIPNFHQGPFVQSIVSLMSLLMTR